MKIWGMAFCLGSVFLTACFDSNLSRDLTSAEKALPYLNMGVRYLDMGELRFAKDNLEKALDWDSNNPEFQKGILPL